MAIYMCSICLFCFERTSSPERCPDCGSTCVRDATNEEVAEYKKNRLNEGNSMLLKDYFQTYKDEIELTRAQNRVESDLYSLIAYIIRAGKQGMDISLRDISTRRTTDFSERFKGKAGFADFIVLERKKISNANILGAIEAKYVDIDLDEKSKQLQEHCKRFKWVLYTNGLKWQLYNGHEKEWEVVLGKIEHSEVIWFADEWHSLLQKLDSIDWFNKSAN